MKRAEVDRLFHRIDFISIHKAFEASLDEDKYTIIRREYRIEEKNRNKVI